MTPVTNVFYPTVAAIPNGDEDNIRKIISDYFKAEKYNVIETCNGKEGLEKFNKNNIDLIILDIMMPELDGWAVCKRIRKRI